MLGVVSRDSGSGSMVQGVVCRVKGFGFRVLWLRVLGVGSRVSGSGFMVQGVGCSV